MTFAPHSPAARAVVRATIRAGAVAGLPLALAVAACEPAPVEGTSEGTTETVPPLTDQCSDPGAEHRVVETRHQLDLDGRTISYVARAGLLPLREHDTGEVLGHAFYVAYRVHDSDREDARPLTFVWNGGPGASSSLLHLTGIGPRIVKMSDEVTGPPPSRTEVVPNDATWLAFTDLVFVDPVGTGFSRASAPDHRENFWSPRGDVEANTEFVRLFLARYDAWDSPVFIAGESYGAGRVAGMSERLQDRGVPPTGAILISGSFPGGTHLDLPSYTATAHFHRRLPPDLQGDLDAALEEAEAWAEGEYRELADREGLLPERREALITALARFTGLSEEVLADLDLPLDRFDFGAAVLEDEGLEVGQYDGRVTQPLVEHDGPYDPRLDASLRPTLDILDGTSVLLRRYLTDELGFACDMVYAGPFGGFWPPPEGFREDWMSMRWDWSPEVAMDSSPATLARALGADPALRVFVGMGVYDLVTTYMPAAEAARRLESDHPGAVWFVTFHGGHAIYHGREERHLLRDNVRTFMDAAVDARAPGGPGEGRR